MPPRSAGQDARLPLRGRSRPCRKVPVVIDDVQRARKCVAHYRKLGLCPLPSRTDRKGPSLDTYAAHFGATPVDEDVYEGMRTPNVQIITGAKSPTVNKIVVVDCDGEGSLDVWMTMCRERSFNPSTAWITRTGSGGHHFYFSLPLSVASCPGGMLWGLWDTFGGVDHKGAWAKHKEVRILGDNALVVAPPSIHVETGVRYAFDASANPKRLRLPGLAPQWLLDFPRLSGSVRCYPDPPRPRLPAGPIWPRSSRHYRREEVLDAIGDRKLSVAKSWGLVTASDTPNPMGWVSCYVPGREDPPRSNPSGSFHFHDGTMQDRRCLSSISLFDLGVTLGHYGTWTDCRDALGDHFIGKRHV